MKPPSFKHQLNKLLKKPSLSDTQFERLEQLISEQDTITTHVNEKSNVSKIDKRASLIGFSLGITVSIVIGLSMFLSYRIDREGSIAREIAIEVVENHLKLKPLDVKASNFSTTANYFNKLDFKPLRSAYPSTSTMTLLGGRYCSIKSVPAAQLRFISTDQNLVSLYQVPDNSQFSWAPQLAMAPPITLYIKGLKVNIWREKGLFMVQVSE